jgi:soluble lytic murein transglycosylase-like protein
MMRILTASIWLCFVPLWAAAQDRPLSPPEKPPVPLTDSDQERARKAELAKPAQKGPAEVSVPAPKTHGKHISSGNPAIDLLAYEAASRHGLDPCLILSVMGAESAYNRNAISPKGASGLMQLMPATAARFGVRNIFDPRENILGGANYLRWLLERFRGDIKLALAGYNAGEGAVEYYGHRIPPYQETQNYVRVIYSRYSRIHAAAGAETTVVPRQLSLAQHPNTPPNQIPTYNQIIRFRSSNGDAEPAASSRDK